MKSLNLILLGLPSSGKTTLLGLLQKAAKEKGAEIVGEFVDPTGELGPLQKSAGDDRYRPTRDAVVAYPLHRHYEGRDEEIVVHDTGGEQTAALLADPDRIGDRGEVPHALAAADGVLLVVDASSSPEELKRPVQQLLSFLESWQRRRGADAQVGGLPVFLVLAKCDKLATDAEGFESWEQKVNRRKAEFERRFGEKLSGSRSRSFGRIDVAVHATAARTPGVGAKPYRVAELFRDLFAAAAAYRQRTERSAQTLHGALVGLGGTAVVLLLLGFWYYATQPTVDETALENRAQAVLAGGEENVAERVREPIADRLNELREVMESPVYGSLPSRTRERIEATLRSIEDYQRLNLEYQKAVRNPRFAVRVADLATIREALDAFAPKVADWPGTRLAKRHDEWLAEVKALYDASGGEERGAIVEAESWLRGQIAAGEKLRAEGGLVIAKKADAVEREAWFKAVHEFQFRERPHKNTDRIKGTDIPYRVVYQFDRVEAAERDWRQFKGRLETLREEAMEK